VYFMLEKEKLLRRQCETETMRGPEQIQEGNIYANTMQDMLVRNQTLQESRFRFWGVNHKDSPAMTQVKTAMADVNGFMQGVIPRSREEFEESLAHLEELYRTLISRCRTYVENHPNPHTASGKERRRIIAGTLGMAQRESLMLREKASSIWETGEAELLWGNVLGEMRRTEIDLDQREVSMGGAGTSEVTIIGTGSDQIFFKDEEALLRPSEEIQRQYVDRAETVEDREIYEKIKRILSDDHTSPTATVFKRDELQVGLVSEDPQVVERAFAMLRSDVRDFDIDLFGLDMENAHVQEILVELLPRYAKWLTRLGICQTAGISLGRSLSVRNVATSRMAALLNQTELISLSQTAVVTQNGGTQIRKGNAMKKARGKSLADLQTQALETGIPLTYSPEAVRQLACLQMMDMICGQIDRNTGNFFVETEEYEPGKLRVVSIQGIDNDMAFGVVDYAELNQFADGTQMLPVFEKDGACTLPALDGNLVAAVNSLSDEVVRHSMQDLLNEREIECLLDRLHGVQRAIARSVAQDPNLVVPTDKWDATVAQRFTRHQVNKAYASI
jgi:hypothetical protein